LIIKAKYCRNTRELRIPAVFLFFVLITASTVFSQENFPSGSRAAALANTYIMESDIWSLSHNQAGLGDYHNFSIGFHHENKFLLEEYAMHSLALTVPVNAGTMGLSYTYFGYEAYNQSKIGIAYGRNFGEKFSAGVQLNYHYTYVANDYENRHALSVEGGIQYKPVNNVRIGVHVFNPTQSHMVPSTTDTLNTTLRAGISYSPVKKLWMGVETEKSLNYQYRLKSAIELETLNGLYLRTGIITHPFQNTFGIGFKISRINADVAFSHSQALGFTPHFSMQIKIREGQKSADVPE
jgi:hypothetical protein